MTVVMGGNRGGNMRLGATGGDWVKEEAGGGLDGRRERANRVRFPMT